jgi:hypothetical protein
MGNFDMPELGAELYMLAFTGTSTVSPARQPHLAEWRAAIPPQ